MQSSPAPAAVRRDPLGAQVADILRAQITAGRLPPGARLGEERLAADIGVSRTPVREALQRLALEGLVDFEPNRGCVVSPLSQTVVAETYPILAVLEALALRTAMPLPPEICTALRSANEEMRRNSARPERRHAADARWHSLLLQNCRNGRLLGLIESLKAFAARYDGALARGIADVDGSYRAHLAVIQAIEKRDAELAARRLIEHWQAGQEVVIRWLAQHKPEGGSEHDRESTRSSNRRRLTRGGPAGVDRRRRRPAG